MSIQASIASLCTVLAAVFMTFAVPPRGTQAQSVKLPAPNVRLCYADCDSIPSLPDHAEPHLANPSVMFQAMTEAYRQRPKTAAIGGSATVAILIGQDGSVREVRLITSSGHATIDTMAVAVGSVIRAAPRPGSKKVHARWYEMPIAFETRDDARQPVYAPCRRSSPITGRVAARAPRRARFNLRDVA